jgi:hypothetical protein
MSHSDLEHRPMRVRSSGIEGDAMRIDRSFVGLGIFFVLIGAIPLAVQGGALTAGQVAAWWRFWPLIIVGIGLGILLRGTPFRAAGGLVIAATAGVMIGSLLAAGVAGFPGDVCGQAERAVTFQTQSGALSENAVVELSLDCGDVTVTTKAGTGWSVEGEDRTPGGPEISWGESQLTVRSAAGERSPLDFVGRHSTWRIALPTDPALAVRAVVNAGSSSFDLSGAHLTDLDLQVSAGSAIVDLGNASVADAISIEVNAGSLGLTLPATSTQGSIQVNAGSVELCASPGVALRLETGGGVISSYDYEGQGLVHDGTTWVSPDYDTAAQRIDLVTEGNAGSFTLNPEEGCHV